MRLLDDHRESFGELPARSNMHLKLKGNLRSGFGVVELLVVIGLSAILFGLTYTTFSGFSDLQSLDKETDVLIAYTQKARNQTVNAKNGNQFGIHYASTSLTIYEGATYAPGAPSNIVYPLSAKVEIQGLSLTGNANRILFEQLNGKPNATGTVRLRLKAKPDMAKTVIIYGSGLIEVQ